VTSGTWALYGHVIPEGRPLAGCWMQVLVGPLHDDVPDPWLADYGVDRDEVPLLGTWDHEPRDWETAEVLPPETLEDHDGCPDDPDGLHHSGCGCPDVDPINPN
jgi:hypothetical protein